MTVGQSLFYGLIQGLTEFLPISSTAHIRILPALLGWEDPGSAFTAVIQIGTLVAVLIYFAQDIAAITSGVIHGILTGHPTGNSEARMGWMIVVGTVPIVVLGVLFKHQIEYNLRSLYVVCGMLIGMAVLLAAAELAMERRIVRGQELRLLKSLGWRDAIVVGLAQAISLIPGASRSGTTITGGLFLGLSRESAARFSFLLSLPSVLAAGIYELFKERQALLSTHVGLVPLIAATVISGVVGYASIAFLLGYLKKHTTNIFVVYRILIGAAVLTAIFTGHLRP